ncbi:taurine ABC transporter substrate-binding protein, partial [Burkholderia pseudomallei]
MILKRILIAASFSAAAASAVHSHAARAETVNVAY